MAQPRALLSVWEKAGIVELGSALSKMGWELLSTGGTARTLRDAGLKVTDVSETTGPVSYTHLTLPTILLV